MTPRLLVVLNPFLGWRTYGRQLTRVLEQRTDISPRILVLQSPRWERMFIKRHNRGRFDRLIRRVDAISAYRTWLGRKIRSEVQRHRPQAIHYGPHLPSAATAYADPSIPFTAILDCTRFNMNDYLGQSVWSGPELQREAALLRRAARLYPMSGWTAASLMADCSVPEERIRILPPSIDLTQVGASARSGGRPRILFIGNDFRRKGGDRLHRWVTGPLAGTCELHIVSEDPEARVTGDNVVHHGRVEHAELMGRLMPGMDIFCLPTRSDMSPHVLAEAAAAGLPAVASDLGGISDLVVHGRTGFLAPPADDQAFVARLSEIIASPDLRYGMGQAARNHARSHFDAALNYNALIDDLVERAGAG